MDITISKIAALALAVAYVIAAGVAESRFGLPRSRSGCCLPLACIWFAEPMGSWTGVWRRYSPHIPVPGLARSDNGMGLACGHSPVRID